MASFSRAYSNMTMSTCLIFQPKNCSISSPHQRDMVAYFLSHLLRCSKAELGRTHPVPQRLPIGAPRKDSTQLFSSTGHLLENHSQGPWHHTTNFSAILHGVLDRANDARTLLQIWLTFYSIDFEKTEFEVWIYHRLWRLWPT